MTPSQCTKDCAPDDKKCCEFGFHFVGSLLFDIYLTVFYILGIIKFALTLKAMKNLETKKTKIFMIKTF